MSARHKTSLASAGETSRSSRFNGISINLETKEQTCAVFVVCSLSVIRLLWYRDFSAKVVFRTSKSDTAHQLVANATAFSQAKLPHLTQKECREVILFCRSSLLRLLTSQFFYFFGLVSTCTHGSEEEIGMHASNFLTSLPERTGKVVILKRERLLARTGTRGITGREQ